MELEPYGSQPGPRGRSRRITASTAFDVTLALPALLSSLTVLSIVGGVFSPTATWLVPLLWFLSSVLIFTPVAERLLARILMGLRRPSIQEQRRLQPIWESACRGAGVRADRYTLWIESSGGMNAFAAGGHIVAVTTTALRLSPARLEAVLAHELGHHLAGHAVAGLLTWWWTVPARLSVVVIGWAIRLVLAIGRLFSFFGAPFAGLVSLVAALGLLILMYMLNPWLLLAPVISPLLAWSSRIGEFHADRVAGELGYAARLVEVLESTDDFNNYSTQTSLRVRLLSSHPSTPDRIARLRAYPSGPSDGISRR